jgi:hypothetical protein
MPETGLHAPARKFFAVRANVPVTLIPPYRAEAMLGIEQPGRRSGKYHGDQHAWPVRQHAPHQDNQGAVCRWRPSAAISDGYQMAYRGLRLPSISYASVLQVLPAALSFTLLGAVESLLSAKVADGMMGRGHRYNMEVGRAHAASPAGLIVGSACSSIASLGNKRPGSGAGNLIPPRSLSWLAKIVTTMPQVEIAMHHLGLSLTGIKCKKISECIIPMQDQRAHQEFNNTMQKFALKLLVTELIYRRGSKRVGGVQFLSTLLTLVLITCVGIYLLIHGPY